jgi:hypothetical protein
MRRHIFVLLFAVGALSCESAPTATVLKGDSRPSFVHFWLGGVAQEGGALTLHADPASPLDNMEAPNVVATEISSQRGERETLFVGPTDERRRVWLIVSVLSREVTRDVDRIVRTWHGRPTVPWGYYEDRNIPGAPVAEAHYWVEGDARQILRLLNGMDGVHSAEPRLSICGFGWCPLPAVGSIPVTADAVVPGDRRFSVRDGDTLTVRYTQPDGGELRRRFLLSERVFILLP